MTIRKGAPFLLFAVVLLGLATSVACSNQESTWDRVRRTGLLKVGLDPTYPPFEFFVGESIQGLDVDLARALAAEKSLELGFQYFGYDGLYDALATEQVDVLISALTPDVARTRDFAYSDGYVDSGLVLVSLVAAPYREPGALRGHRLGAELGAAGHVKATIWQRQVKDLSVATYISSDETLQALASGQVDAAIVDNITYRLFDRSSIAVAFAAATITSEPYTMVVRHEDDQLLAEMNDALSALKRNGHLDSILNSWLSG